MKTPPLPSANHAVELNSRLVFLVGCPRSGTTWLMWLLAQHPSVVVCYHAAFFHALKPLRDWWQERAGYGKSIYAKNNQETQNGDSLSKTNLNSILTLDEFYEYSRVLGINVFNKIAQCGNSTKVIVEKTPENLKFYDLILKIFPEAYILHIIRDPRSVFASNCKAVYSWADPKEFPTSPIQAARRWCAYIERGKQTKQLTNRYREVRYETLFENGCEELQQIYSWLGLTAAPDFYETALKNSTIDKLRNRKGLAPEGFFRKGETEAWRHELSASEIRVIEYISGDLMSELGYASKFGPAKHKPFRCWRYEISSKFLHRMVESPISVLWKFARVIPWMRQLQPRKRVQAFKKTLAGMSK